MDGSGAGLGGAPGMAGPTSGRSGPDPRAPSSLLPGLAICAGFALLAGVLRSASGLAAISPVVLALLFGLCWRAALGLAVGLKPGITFAVRPLLRSAIVLLGLQVTLAEVLGLGPGALLLALLSVGTTLPVALWLGPRLGVSIGLSALLGTGTGICGASAIVAANQVVRAGDEDVTYALAIVTLCGTAGLVFMPLLLNPLGLSPAGYGLWAGAALHEVVQAVGAAAAGGAEAAQAGTVMKLARVMLLAPAILVLGWWLLRGSAAEGTARVPVPWFAFGFLGMVALASAGLVPQAAIDASRLLVPLMLAASLAALGLSTDLHAMRARGLAPLMLGILLTLSVTLVTLFGILLLGRV